MNNDIVQRLRAEKDGKPATPLELEAAGVIESMEFQLKARWEKAPCAVCSSSTPAAP